MSPRHFELIQECFNLPLKGICVHRGITDLDYQGEISVILLNEEKDDLLINKHNQIVNC